MPGVSSTPQYCPLVPVFLYVMSCRLSSWVSVLQNSKDEALNTAFKGDQDEGEDNIVQELTKAIVAEVKRMSGNDGCCDCGAAGQYYCYC